MANISQFYHEGRIIDHTPDAALDAGNIIQVGSLAAFCPEDIAAGIRGGVAVSGVLRVPFVGGIVANIGDNVWWDANGTPYGGAADGAATHYPAAGDWWLGTLVRATTATGTTCDVALNVENKDSPAWQNKTTVAAVDDTTLVAATHSGGVVSLAAATAKTFTLPVGVVGMDFVLVNNCADGILCTVDLNGTEIVAGANLTVANGHTAKNTAATAKRGDFLHLVCNVAATSWRCVAKRGVWVGSAA